MAAALQATFDLPMAGASEGEEADVLLITDGEVWDACAACSEAERGGVAWAASPTA